MPGHHSRNSTKWKIGSVLIYFAICLLGTAWALKRGAHDFEVFYIAASKVGTPDINNLYDHYAKPDRYLYHPGFAWLFSIFTLVPFKSALVLWCALKTVIGFWGLLFFSNSLARLCPENSWVGNIPFLSIIALSRLLLMDFQYGQVNFLLMVSLLVLVTVILCTPEKSTRRLFTFFPALSSGLFFSIFTFAKLITFPFLFLPILSWIRFPRTRKRDQAILAGFLLGVILLTIPVLWSGGLELLSKLTMDWFASIRAKGMPYDGHNQSFAAFMHRILGGQVTTVLFDKNYFHFHFNLLEGPIINKAALVFGVTVYCFIGKWFIRYSKAPSNPIPLFLSAAALVLPPYLVWKHYYIFSFFLLSGVGMLGNRKVYAGALVFSFILFNFTGFDFVGTKTAALFEASSLFFWVHAGLGATLALFAYEFGRSPKLPKNP